MQSKQTAKQHFVQKRKIAVIAWTYFVMLIIAVVTLGVLFVALLASLKDDALKDPAGFVFPQVQPKYIYQAIRLGIDGANAPLFGGMKSGKTMAFEVTYAVPENETKQPLQVEIPRRTLGSGMAAIAYPDFAADYVEIQSIELVETMPDISFVQQKGLLRVPHIGTGYRYRITLDYKQTHTDAPYLSNVPLQITGPRYKVLIDSTLPANRFERRGRVASWNNVSPGLLGYTFKSYLRVWNESISIDTGKSLFLSWTLNSFGIAFGKMLLTVFIACTAGYALARMRFKGRSMIYGMMIISMTVPMQVSFISNYQVYNALGLLNTPWAVITMVVASAQVLIMKQFFETMPKELEESAIIDGASQLHILWYVFIPLAKPAILSISILAFQGAWNDFFWPLVVLTSPADAFTLPLGLMSLRNSYGVAGDWNLILAGAFMSTVPVLLIFIFFQKYFVNTNVGSAVKG